MGDPHKKDVVKPDSTFDDDDYHTINELKRALSEQLKYNFMYLSNHDTLIKDLLKMKGKCSFVI